MSTSLISSEISEPYAQALLDLSQSLNETQHFADEFKGLQYLFDQSPEFSEFIANPVIKTELKKSFLRRVIGDKVSRYLYNFLDLLIDKRRIVFLQAIVEQYLKLVRELNQVVLAEVISAREFSSDQQYSLIDKVRGITGATEVELKTSIDKSLIGGVVIKIGSQVIDVSLKAQLRRIGMSLAK
jgi:F-type H+-transporting ATPase subunit delta